MAARLQGRKYGESRLPRLWEEEQHEEPRAVVHPQQPGAPQGQAVVAVVSLQHVASTHGHSSLQTWLWTCLAAWAAALRWGWVSSSGSFSFIFFSLLFPYNPHPHRNVLNNSSSTPVLSPRMSIRRCATRPLSSQSCTLTFCTR